jgi:hypothetical protein
MAKRRIENYVFRPGMSYKGYVLEDAYILLDNNQDYIIAEITAWLARQVAQGDTFTPTDATYNPETGLMTLNIGSHTLRAGDMIRIAEESITFTCTLDGNSSPKSYPRSSGVPNDSGTDPFYDQPIFITSATSTEITVFVGISSDLSDHTFVSATDDSVTAGLPGYTYNVSKCERDVGFILNAYKNDIRYGGTELTYDYVSRYWESDVSQLDGDKIPEVAAHTYIRDLINNYIFTNTLYNGNQGSVAQYIDETKSVVDYTLTPTGAIYTPTTGVMTLTVGSHNISVDDEIFIAPNSITFTCTLDANATEHSYPRPSGVPNDTGHDPFWEAPLRVTSVTDTTITVNVGISSDTSTHTFVSADANSITSGPVSKITVFANRVTDTIRNGLNKRFSLVLNRYGMVKIQGKYNLAEILLISNNTTNEVLFNFTDPNKGAVIKNIDTDTLVEINDSDFPKYLQTTDGVTTLKLNYNSSSGSSTDDIQIFVEEKETRVRPYDFGTDAIERMRVAPALSMLDADFEYGLQPTKWSAIGMIRGYPSVYEVPGSERAVLQVTTDASSGTEGIGQSLITVDTVSPHGLEAGQAITIKALENSISGAARAEGAFIITTVPDNNTFTFYAKAKVGDTPGEVLSTTFTQLREANFYTGANISVKPEFEVLSNGVDGEIVTELGAPTNSTIIPYDGRTPEIGAPLTHPSIPSGAQVTEAITLSAGGGTYLTANLVGDTGAGLDTVEVDDATGIITNLAYDRGDGTATFVESINGNLITFTDPFTTSKIGTDTTYTGVTGSNVNSNGDGAVFDISTSSGNYTVDEIVNGGSGYEVGDRIFIDPANVGGISPANDLVLIVDTTEDTDNKIASVTVEGTAFSGTASIPGLQPEVEGGLGFNAVFDITFEDNTYTDVALSNGNSEAYSPYDIIKIPGSQISGGSDGTNDMFVTVQTVSSLGEILTASVSGTAPDADVEYQNINNSSYTYSGTTGSGAVFTINRTGTVYSANIVPGSEGSNYLPTETFTIDGALLGGSSTTNDCTITIDNVDGSGAITAVSVGGIAANIDTTFDITGNNLVGSGAEFTVDINAGAYNVTVTTPGSDYGVNQTFIIPGSQLAGQDITNDLTITITALDDLIERGVDTVSTSGTASNGTASYTDITGINQDPAGSGASFDIRRNNGVYTVSLVSGGVDYEVGNKIDILGTQLGGVSPLNDVRILIDTVNTGVIDTFTEIYEEAVLGDAFELIATVSISEPTTDIISDNTTITYSALASIKVTFPNAHGLIPGSTFITTVQSDDGANNHSLAAGSFIATSVPEINELTFQARAPGNIDTGVDNSDPIAGTVYPRPDSFFVHRPFDGGVQLGTGGPQHGAQAIRQSKNYIRYQSGKGIMYTTGALFAPSYDLRSVTADDIEVGSTITVVTDDNDHGLQIGSTVRLIGVETEGYNSGPETAIPPRFDYTVTRIVDERTFEIEAQRRLGSTTAVLGFAAQMSVVAWHGATVRSGIFDDQNGIFWEYDGTQISVVQRTGTKQIAGTVAITADDNLLTGTNTRFRDQLKAGDRIIIKGMTHVVSHVNSQTELTVTPDFRGVNSVTGAKAMLITDKKAKQSEFNLDRLDGTGPSGYNMDEAKMQMIGIQYSWYGAGFIDFMVRGSNGNFVFAHRMRNSNVNTEAFMRSGNLPVRYEVTNEGPPGRLAEDMTDVQTTVVLDDASFFPTGGTIYIDNEIIRYTSKSGNTLTGCTRGTTLNNFQAGAARTYSAGDAAAHEAKTGVILISNTLTPLISHWGSAFITDGGFDEDRGYIFSYTESSVTVSTTKQTAFLIRLAPSVSNAITGDLGEQELLNRAQLLLQGIELTSDTGTGGIVVEGILNPSNYPINPDDVGWGSLTGLAQGGQPSFAQVASGGSVSWSSGEAATNSTATASPQLSVQLNSGLYDRGRNSDFIWVSASDYRSTFGSNDTSLVIGNTITGSAIQSNTTITDARIDATGNYGWFRISRRTTSNISRNTTDAYTILEGGDFTDRNFAYFDTASYEASGATLGTAVTTTGGDVTFPPNTSVSSIELKSFGPSNYYVVTFNNSYSGTLNAGTDTIQFEFVQPPFAQPGETVFSFIAQPGERSTLDLAQLKELTNTTLGGRGTFPNGPDVLALNVYKVSGADIESNIILRWGEAQA